MITLKFEDYFFGKKITNEEKERGYISFQTIFWRIRRWYFM